MEKETIGLYEAIEEMRRISRQGGTFRLRFRKYNRATGEGGDMATIEHARVRPKASDERVSHSGHKLFFTDTDEGRALNCWHPLIMEFDGKRVES